MTPIRNRSSAEDRPSPWAVALLIASSGLALISILLLSTGFGIA